MEESKGKTHGGPLSTGRYNLIMCVFQKMNKNLHTN